MKRVLLTTGGTGGHIFPALAVAEELRARGGVELLFMGSLYGPEKRLAENAGIRFVGLPVRGMLGRGVRAVAAAGRLLAAMPMALRVVKDFAPDCAAGFGGYAAFAPLFAARLLRVPSVLHEQNAVGGVTNRVLARVCDRICVSLPGTSGFGKRELALTGNPVRRCIFEAGKVTRSFDRRHLLVVGGSQGAHPLNALMMEILPALKETGVSVIHQTGEKDYQEVARAYQALGMDDCRVAPFVDDMEQAYAWADLGLTRAGASTVAELCGTGLPSLLVPFPQAAHDHQTFNARALEKAGAARLLVQKDLDAGGLLAQLRELLADPARLHSMSQSALCLATPLAAANVVTVMEAAAADRRGVRPE
ncbi:MAG: undecaprenyldiphospho-muramoylpentapeptide beta-N-acetylglucosaminyltransferase [Desulfovibrionaceae bacterium]|nr:undecaprenyldiphospho-muramoylpentapeptide beta-N-acetylglucosaminyltransferase [Desulfovibrionaceae bacterium]